MAPKKKTIAAVSLSGAAPPVPVRTGDVAHVGGGGDQDRPRHPDARSQASGIVRNGDDGPHTAAPKEGAAQPTGGTGTSKGRNTTPPAHVSWFSQLARDEQRRDVEDPGRRREKIPQHHSQDAQGRHACHDAGEKGARSRNRDETPNIVRSPSSSHSSRLSLPPT